MSKRIENSKLCQKGFKVDDVDLNCASEHEKVWSWTKLLKYWIAGVTDEFSSETQILWKRLSTFVYEVHTVFFVTLSTFLHMLCGWNDDTLPSFDLFRVHFEWFWLSWWFSSENKWVKASKIANYIRKGWKLMTWIWIVHMNEIKYGVVLSY